MQNGDDSKQTNSAEGEPSSLHGGGGSARRTPVDKVGGRHEATSNAPEPNSTEQDDKPSRREVDIKATWTGFEIPDEFVVGYGIDYAQRNRNLDHIGCVRFPT